MTCARDCLGRSSIRSFSTCPSSSIVKTSSPSSITTSPFITSGFTSGGWVTYDLKVVALIKVTPRTVFTTPLSHYGLLLSGKGHDLLTLSTSLYHLFFFMILLLLDNIKFLSMGGRGSNVRFDVELLNIARCPSPSSIDGFILVSSFVQLNHNLIS